MSNTVAHRERMHRGKAWTILAHVGDGMGKRDNEPIRCQHNSDGPREAQDDPSPQAVTFTLLQRYI